MADDLGPVEVQFTIPDTFGKEADAAIKQMATLTAAGGDMPKELIASITRSQIAIQELKKDLIDLQAAAKIGTSGMDKGQLAAETATVKKNLLDEQTALKDLETQLRSYQTTAKNTSNVNLQHGQSIDVVQAKTQRLNYATQQILREVPSTVQGGIGMFFMAISNNIPMLQDQMQNMIALNRQLKAEGQATTPVWKQLLGSVFSWQTGILLGITILTMYGKEIGEWTKKLFTNTQAEHDKAEAEKKTNELLKIRNDMSSDYGKQMSSDMMVYDKLKTQWNELGGSLDKQQKFIKGNQSEFSKLGIAVNSVSDAEKLFVTQTDKVNEALQARAMYTASMAAAQKEYEQFFTNMAKAQTYGQQPDKNAGKFTIKKQKTDGNSTIQETLGADFTKQANEAKKGGDRLNEIGKEYRDKFKELLKSAGLSDFVKGEFNTGKKIVDQFATTSTELERIVKETQDKISSTRIAALQDGATKQRAQAQADYDKEISDIKLQRAQVQNILAKAAKEKDPSKKNYLELEAADAVKNLDTLEQTALNSYNAKITQINAASKLTLDQLFQEVNSRFENDLDQKTAAIDKYYNEQIKKAREAGATIAQLDQLEKDRKNEKFLAINKNQIEQIKLDEETSTRRQNVANDDLVNENQKQARLLEIKRNSLAKQREVLLSLNQPFTNDTANQVGDIDAQIAGLNKQIGKLNASPLELVIEDWTKLKAAIESGSPEEKVNAMAKALESSSKLLNQFGDAASEGLGALEQMGVLSSDQADSTKQTIADIQKVAGGASQVAKGIATMNPVDILSGGIKVLSGVFSLFDSKSRDIAKKQKALKQDLADLTLQYQKLQNAVKNALGTDVYSAKASEIKNQTQQIADLQNLIYQEQRKKKKKQDQKAIEDWKNQIVQLQQSITETQQAITEELAQTSAKDLANELADAITGAWTSGTDAANAYGDVSTKVLQNAVKNALKLQLLEKPLDSIVNDLASQIQDGTLTTAEEQQFKDKIAALGQTFNSYLSQYADLFSSTASSTATTGAFTAMSQDTASDLLGQFTALKVYASILAEWSKEEKIDRKAILTILQNIQKDTSNLPLLVDINSTLAYIKTNGVKVA